MKNHTSLMELVCIISLMVGCVPLLLLLILACHSTSYSYLQDKSIRQFVQTEYDSSVGTMVVSGATNITLSEPQVAGVSYVQDDYCPDIARKIYFDCNGSDFSETTIQNYLTSPKVVNMGDGNNKALSVLNGWRVLRDNRTLIKYQVVKSGNMDFYSEQYLVWNATNNCWVISPYGKYMNMTIN